MKLDKITVLSHDDSVVLDTELLGNLYTELGETGADTMICRALDELSTRLMIIERCYNKSDKAGLQKAANGLVTIANQLGMKNLCNVGKDVSTLAQLDDSPALAAALARLVRLGDQALTAVWEIQDLDGAI